MTYSPLPVNEIFSSIQGEGYFTGTPAVFVRLQSCPVGCPWCDTKHTWEKKADRRIPFDTMLKKTVDADTWADAGVDTLCRYLRDQPEKLVVFTGGEPCLYELGEISARLSEMGKQVQVETSGTEEIKVHDETWVTLSPKLDMPGGRQVLMGNLYLADEIKMPVGKQDDVEKLKRLLEALVNLGPPVVPVKTDVDMPLVWNGDMPLVWLQPLSQSPKATELCIEQARLNGWRLSAQLHRYLKVR